MKQSTRDSYFNRIDRVVGFLSEKVEEAPSLETMAGIAAISPFHFHRVYRAVTGETPSATVRRLRLAKACGLLRDLEKPVTEVAFDVGYDSSQGFAKALKEVTGYSARDLRADPAKLEKIVTALASAPGVGNVPKDLDVKIVSVDPFEVVAYRHTGPHKGLFKAYGDLHAWAAGAGLLEKFRGIYGIPIDDPRGEDPDAVRFDACFDFGPRPNVEAPYRVAGLGGGRYAVVRHVGPYEGLEAFYDYLYGPWLETSGYQLREAPAFNNYIQDPDSVPPEEWETDIYIPVEKGSDHENPV